MVYRTNASSDVSIFGNAQNHLDEDGIGSDHYKSIYLDNINIDERNSIKSRALEKNLYIIIVAYGHLDIILVTTAESTPLHIGGSRTRTRKLWFPSASR